MVATSSFVLEYEYATRLIPLTNDQEETLWNLWMPFRIAGRDAICFDNTI